MRRFGKKVLLLGSFTILPLCFAYAKEVARVNHVGIVERDLRASLLGLNDGQREAILKDLNLRQRIILQAVNQELIAQEAQKLKLDQDADFKSTLNYQRNQLLMAKFIEAKIAPKMTEQGLKNYYEKHKDKFGTHLVRIQQILLETEKEAIEVLKKARDPKRDFQSLAEDYSKDPTAKNNRGEVGYVYNGQIDSDLWQIAFATPVGGITEPIKNIAGYHLLKVLDKKTGKPLEYSEVEGRVKAELQDELMASYLTNLRKSAKIYIDHDVLKK